MNELSQKKKKTQNKPKNKYMLIENAVIVVIVKGYQYRLVTVLKY